MTSSIQELNLSGFPTCLPAGLQDARKRCDSVLRSHQHRAYGLAFWMTGHELDAERITAHAFRRAFAASSEPSAEMVDRALVAELRETMPIGTLTLACSPATAVLGVRHNFRRTDLERSLVQLPATERLIYLLHDAGGCDHARIARTLGLREQDCRRGLHQARLRLRELLAGT